MAIRFNLVALLLYLLVNSIAAGQTRVTGAVSGTWTKAKSPYILAGTATVPTGQTLIIESGVIVDFPDVSYNLDIQGTLLAQGTVSDSIRFRGHRRDANSNYGGRLYFRAGGGASVLQYMAIDSLGDSYFGEAAINIISPQTPTIQHVSITHSELYDVRTWIGGVTNFNDVKAFVGITGGAGVLDARLPKLNKGSGYKLLTTIVVDKGTKLTIDPGVVLDFPDFTSNLDIQGTLLAQGTASDSIRFRGHRRDANSNYGGRLYFRSGGGASVLQYMAIDSLGDSYFGEAAINISSPQTPTIQHVTLRTSEQYDVRTWIGGVTNFTDVKAFVGITGGAGALDARLPKLNKGSGYKVLTNIVVDKGTKLTIDPGVVLDFPDFTSNLDIQGTLLAQGTASDSIRFRGHRRDANSNYGGRLYFRSGGGASVLQYMAIDSLGDSYFGEAAINIISPQTPTIQHVSITHSELYDVRTWIGGVTNFNDVKAFVGITSSAGSFDARLPKLNKGSTYKLLADITVDRGTRLIIEPGVIVDFPDYTYNLNIYGTLLAQGTESDSIRFRGHRRDANSSYGGRLYFRAGGGASVLQYMSIDSLGDNYFGEAAVNINVPQTPTIQHVTFRNSEQYDVRTWIGGAANFVNVRSALIGINASAGAFDARVPKPGLNSFYRFISPVIVDKGQKLTIEPGVFIEMPTWDQSLNVYGTLLAQGTANDLIRFQGHGNPKANVNSTHGGGIFFRAGGIGSVLQFVAIDSLGDSYYGDAAITISTNCSIKNVTVQNPEQTAISITDGSLTPVIQGVRFTNCSIPIKAYSGNCTNVFNNTNATIFLQNSTLFANATWPLPGPNSYYLLTGQAQVPQAFMLTIEAGTLVDFGTNGELMVAGTLRAVGTESNPIRLTRLQSTTASTTGRVILTSTSTNSVLNFVNLDKLGGATNGLAALDIATANFSIGNISISNSVNRALQLTNSGSSVISGSNFVNNKTGVYVSGGKPVFTNCNIYGNSDFGINNVSGIVADTVDARNCYWGSDLGPYHATLNPTGKGNAVSNKVKFNPWKRQPQNGQIVDIGISALVAPITDCNHTAADNVTVRIRNYGNVSQSGFSVSYRINKGTAVTETVSTTALSPGESLDYTFTQKANLSVTGSYTLAAYSAFPADTFRLNDTVRVTIQHLPGVVAPANLIPVTNTTNLAIPVKLSWAAVAGALAYDLYVWKSDAAVPTQPLAANISQIAYNLSGSLQYGTQYRWKVVARQVSCRAESAINLFTTRQQPDLLVESINSPATGTSETEMSISWKVKNQGTGATQETAWLDQVYLCDQPILNAGSDNFFIDNVPNFSALGVGQSYQSAPFTFRLPQGIQGKYYLIVQTNPSHSLPEAITTNNQLTSQPITISLAPPPDLQVTSVVAPTNAFSEDSITVAYTVRNSGTGPTTATTWIDQIFLSQKQTVDVNTDKLLYSRSHNQPLAVNVDYTVPARLKLPDRIGGTYYLHAVADRNNQVFEYNKEDNNSRASAALTIVQRPTPNLVIHDFSTSVDTIAPKQPVTLQWTTANEGALGTTTQWLESIYLSTDTMFSAAADRLLGNFWRSNALQSLSSSSTQQILTIPASTTEGTYYLFIKTDATDRLYESPGEDDNVARLSLPVHVVLPDLRPTVLTAPASVTSEQTVSVQWKTKNDSRAGVYNTSWKDKLYLSSTNSFSAATDKLLNTVTVNQLLGAGSDYTKQISATLPTGVSGKYFLVVVNDADSSVTEKTKVNNVQSFPVTVALAPWPDLQVVSLIAPVTDTLGTTINVQYTAKNNGSGLIDNRTWRDSVYLSPTTTLNKGNRIYLGTVFQNRSLAGGQTFSQSAVFTIPTGINPGQYYLAIKTDADSTIFENTAEANNITVATKATSLVVPPAIDLAVTAGNILSASVVSGQPITLQWTVKNTSGLSTVVSAWQDAIYLSANPVLDASDVLLGTIDITKPLAAGATYTKAQTVSIPPTSTGTLYVLVTTDRDNRNYDVQRGNNTLVVSMNGGAGQPVNVSIPPPADLVPLSLFGPAEGIASQPISISFTVKNNGTGSTPASNWTDELYLSTDMVLGNDLSIATFPHAGTLPPGADYTVAKQVFLPASASGNYVLLLKTDAGNAVFERGNEANNIALANLSITAQQPSDLIASDIRLPATPRFAGSTATVSWQLSNGGPNAVNGYLREAVYLSRDSTFDATDVLFGTLDGTLYLPPNATQIRKLEKPLADVGIGEYFAIVKTDIQNTIVEQNEGNNQAVSVGKITITVKELALNKLTADTLANNAPLYYRLDIPNSLAGEALAITLKGDSVRNAINRIYIRKDTLPTPNQYTYLAAEPFTANQQALIPGLQAGTYYMLGLGADTTKSKQPVNLLARIIPFGITTVDAREGGNTGMVTVKITGARFEPTTRFSLRNKLSTPISSYRVKLIDQTLAYVTFDLQNKALGQYDVVAEKPGSQTVVLANAFTIRQGPGNSLATSGNGGPAYGTGFICTITNDDLDQQLTSDFVTPAAIRFATVGSFTVYFKNEGSVDMPVPTRFLIATSEGASLSFTADKLNEGKTDLTLVCKEENGPPGILRPGASGFFKIYTISKTRGVLFIDLILIE